MKRALIITGFIEHPEELKETAYEFCRAAKDEAEVICADKGWKYAEIMGLKPDFYIGDYDSSEKPPKAENIKILQCEKDDTDTEAAVSAAYSHGAEEVLILGGLGGRFDHTMGNIGVLARFSAEFKSIVLVDSGNRVFFMRPGVTKVWKDGYKYLGIFAYGGIAKGVSLKGFKYTLDNFDLGYDTSLGVSNEITSESAEISLKSGLLLVVQSNDRKSQ